MIINGISGNKRLEVLAKSISDLILSGVSTDKILVLTLNSFKKDKLIALIQDILLKNDFCGYSQLNISTFAGLVYNSILKNWVNIEKIIGNKSQEFEVFPTLSGLDVSQYFLQKIIKEKDFDDYFSKKNLMHQLLRRYKLIVENSLSDAEVRLKADLISETFGDSALKTINSYKIESSKNRIFDNLKQISSFMYLLKSEKINDFNNIEYFFADDADEYSYTAFEFCKYMIKSHKNVKFFLDKNGCSRKGYLCGYSDVYNDLIKEFHFEEITLDNSKTIKSDATKIFNNLLFEKTEKLDDFEIYSYSKRLEMIEGCANKIIELLSKGIPLNKINIITPVVDNTLIYSLQEFLKSKNIKLQSLTGNKKITDNLYVYASITILELLNSNWNILPNIFEIKILLNRILNIPVYDCDEFLSFYKKKLVLKTDNTKYEQYNILIELLNDEELKNKSLQDQFDVIFKTIIAPNMLINSDFEPINLFMKSISEFENLQSKFSRYDNIQLSPNDWLLHIKNSVVSQNPSKPTHINNDALIISTPQKIVDFAIESDYQFWLDTTSYQWFKEDVGTIYNAWVFQKNYSEKEYTPELNRQFTLDKNARLLRKLVLLSREKILTFSSVFDASGRENFGELQNFIELEEKQKSFKFIPRDDQKEILNYKSGKLAVPAVPGAGKTTVMLALLVELVKSGINPQNILVLTYMASAARNFLTRFKTAVSTTRNLPQISTIHAFAFKILMENNNYIFVNLPENFSICDDSMKTSLIKDICAYNLPVGENIDDYSQLMLAAISKAKTNQLEEDLLKNFSKDTQIDEFRQIYKEYQKRLRDLSLLDYDDLLIYAVKLLDENNNIAEFYQDKFKIIIEDEAQDSSVIQQKFIKILSEKYNNVIRCGDVNQAILGTFSNSDVRGFKDFIRNNNKIEMFRSQRCAKEIYEFANDIIDETKKNQLTKDSFYDLKMQGVDGKNPNNKNCLHYNLCETPVDEKEFIINDISKKLSDKNNLPSIAILVRTNRQVAFWSDFLAKQGVKIITRGDTYRQKKVFQLLLSAVELFVNPTDNKCVAKFYKSFCNVDKLVFDNDLYEFIEKNENIVLHPDFIRKNSANGDFEKFWWEAFSIVENNTLDIQEIVIHCANTYFDDITDKSNAFLFSILMQRYVNTLDIDEKFKLNYIPEMLKYFKNLLTQKNLKGINFFSKEDDDTICSGYVQIMTVHKSKGAEFDYVYLPEFTDYNYSMNFERCCSKIQKRKNPLLSKITKIISGKDVLVSETAVEEIEETLRLIYVAVTRAKKGLMFSYSKINEFKKNNLPVELIENLLAVNEVN